MSVKLCQLQTPNLCVMNPMLKIRILLGCLLLGMISLQAQNQRMTRSGQELRSEADKRIENYLQLVKLGYSDNEIYEDLGNANFLAENYETAAFWYQKLIDLQGVEAVAFSYLERYKYAQHQAGIVAHRDVADRRDWYAKVRDDYRVDNTSYVAKLTQDLAANYQMPDFGRSGHQRDTDGLDALRAIPQADLAQLQSDRIGIQDAYLPPVALTADGQMAYFSKAVPMKPLTGLFSKKQLVHKLYSARKINGKWSDIRELGVVPKYASAMHPAVSADGRRLYFSSDMPGSFGKYDIYVSDIQRDGSLGVARNMGDKVNTRRNEMFPSLVGDDVLFFASDGRDGFGGLDLYAARVAPTSVGLAVNIGSPFNSAEDDLALNLNTDSGMASVVSNRGTRGDDVRELVITYQEMQRNGLADNRRDFMDILSVNSRRTVANTHFED